MFSTPSNHRKDRSPSAFDPTGKCPAFVVNPQIARAALRKQHADEVQYAQLVTANTPVAPIHSGLDGGMNRVFLAPGWWQHSTGKSAAVEISTVATTDNNGPFASRLFELVWMEVGSTDAKFASADSTTLERGAHSAATGSILAPKIKSAPQGYTVASAIPNEPYTNEGGPRTTYLKCNKLLRRCRCLRSRKPLRPQ